MLYRSDEFLQQLLHDAINNLVSSFRVRIDRGHAR